MDTALPQKFSFILDRNLAKANCTDNQVCTFWDIVVLNLKPTFNQFQDEFRWLCSCYHSAASREGKSPQKKKIILKKNVDLCDYRLKFLKHWTLKSLFCGIKYKPDISLCTWKILLYVLRAHCPILDFPYYTWHVSEENKQYNIINKASQTWMRHVSQMVEYKEINLWAVWQINTGTTASKINVTLKGVYLPI